MNDEDNSPQQKSGGVDFGNTHAGRDANINLERVAGRDLNETTIHVASGATLIVGGDDQKPGFLEKPGFSKLELPLDEVPKPASLPPGSRMPLGLNPHFVGRERELKWLAETLQRGDTAAIGQLATITGLGGIGKSQLAITFAHHYGPFFEGGVFWVSMAEAANVPAELAQCGYAMNLEYGYENLTLEEQVRRVQQAWQEPIPRLLLFDNCEDEALLAQWRPKTGGGRVLATSRRASWDSSLGVATLPLDTLTPTESRALLQSLAPHLNDAQANAIAEELGHLPLALHLAGSYLHTYRHASFAQPDHYLSELKAERLEHISLQGEGTNYSPTAHERHVGRTFALSLERLNPANEIDQLALSLFARAAHFAPGEPIPRTLFLATAGVTDDNRTDLLQGEQAIARLVELGLLTEESETGWPIIHRLIAAFVQAKQVDKEARTQIEKIIANEAFRLNMTGYPRRLLPWQRQLRFVTEQALSREDERAAILANRLSFHLKSLGEYRVALPLQERSVALCEQVLGLDHPETAQNLNNLAELLRHMGDIEASRSLHERTLAIRERILGPNHPDTAQSMSNLALALVEMGDTITAQPLLERTIIIREQALGANHTTVATSLNNLAGVLQDEGDSLSAYALYERSLTIWEQALGPDHPNIAVSLNNLAGLLQDMGDSEKARAYYERALAICEHALGIKHPSTAISLNNLAGLMYISGDYAAARPLYERALTILEQKLGPDHPNTQTVRNNLALLGE